MDRKVWANRSQETSRNLTILIPKQNIQQSKANNHVSSVSIQRVPINSRIPQKYYDEYMFIDKEKQAATGRWVLNVIAAHEAYQQALKINIKQSPIKKNHNFPSRNLSKVEPIEQSSVFLPQTINEFPHHTILTTTTIDNGQTTPISNYSSSTSIDHVQTLARSSISSQSRTNSRLEDYSIDEFKDKEKKRCISKRMMIICTILSVILIIGIIIAVFITIFIGKNQSTNSTENSLDPKSLLISLFTIDGSICPTEMFNITDSLCNGQKPYNYYSCYQMATSTTFTIQFALQHDTISGHWYLDDISAVQNNNNIQLIINGGFELNMTGWSLNISSNSTSEIYVDRMTNLAHTGLAYLYGASKNSSIYIQQTFNVTQGEYIKVSFWWGYDEGINIGRTCQAIGQLIPLF